MALYEESYSRSDLKQLIELATVLGNKKDLELYQSKLSNLNKKEYNR